MLHAHATRVALVAAVTVSTVALPTLGSVRGPDAAISGEVVAAGGLPAGLEVAALDDLGAQVAVAAVHPDGWFRLAGLAPDNAVYVALRDGDGRVVGYWDGDDGLTADIDEADPAWVRVGDEVRASLTLPD